jgi:hypothetical protein
MITSNIVGGKEREGCKVDLREGSKVDLREGCKADLTAISEPTSHKSYRLPLPVKGRI